MPPPRDFDNWSIVELEAGLEAIERFCRANHGRGYEMWTMLVERHLTDNKNAQSVLCMASEADREEHTMKRGENEVLVEFGTIIDYAQKKILHEISIREKGRMSA